MNIKVTVCGIELSIQNISDRYDELLKNVRENDRDIKNLTKRVETKSRMTDQMGCWQR